MQLKMRRTKKLYYFEILYMNIYITLRACICFSYFKGRRRFGMCFLNDAKYIY